MKNTWMAIPFAALAISVAALAVDSNTSNSATTIEPIRRIVRLSRESERTDARCRTFVEGLQAATADSEKAEFFVSRASAMSALEKVDHYPGTPLSTGETIDTFLSLPSLPSGTEALEIRYALARLSHCHSAEFYGVLTRLIDPRSRRHFKFSEDQRLRQYLLSYLQRESDGGPLFLFQVEFLGSLLSRAVYTGLLPASVTTRGAIADLIWGLEKLKREDRKRFKEQEIEMSLVSSSLRDSEKITQSILENAQWQFEKAEDYRMEFQEALELERNDFVDNPEMGIPAMQVLPRLYL